MRIFISAVIRLVFKRYSGGHGSTVVTHLSPTSEVSGSNPGPYVGKLVVAY